MLKICRKNIYTIRR